MSETLSQTTQKGKANRSYYCHTNHMKQKKSKIVSFKKHAKTESKPLSPGKRILLNIAAAIIAILLLLIGATILFEVQRNNSGFKEKDKLITTYFDGLNQTDKAVLKTCFYPTLPDADTDIQTQLDYAASEIGKTTWKSDDIKTEWTDLDTSVIQEVLSSIKIDNASQCIAFVPLEQKLENGITMLQEDVYQFYIHETKGKWYIAAFQQTARNVTGGIKADGTKMTNTELDEWLTSLAKEIGSDKVGYLLVDNYWNEITGEETETDDQIKAYVTNDYSSYMTMSVIKDTDVTDFQKYSSNIIQTSEQNYGEIMASDGIIGTYETDVQIAQNTETGARIIVWVFKTSKDDEYTHVITLESLSDYDASTYINTFHLEKQKTDETDNVSGDNTNKTE